MTSPLTLSREHAPGYSTVSVFTVHVGTDYSWEARSRAEGLLDAGNCGKDVHHTASGKSVMKLHVQKGSCAEESEVLRALIQVISSGQSGRVHRKAQTVYVKELGLLSWKPPS